MKRLDISRLKKNRATYLQLGFIVALSTTVLAFNYTQYDYENPEAAITFMENDLDDVAVIRTPATPPRQLPPPVVRVSEELLVETEELTEELPPQLEPTNLDTAIRELEGETPMHFVVDKVLPPPPPPPAEPATTDEIFVVVEKMPIFGDCTAADLSRSERQQCSDRALLTYLAAEIRYPALARENNIAGTAVIQFTLDETGQVQDAEIIRNLAGGCGQEALRVIKKMPNWIPGQQRTHKVKVRMTLPVRFRLQ